MIRTAARTVIPTIALVLLLQTVALAGPPLLCHPFNIGEARSLPFQGPAWSQVDPSYSVTRLLDDTSSLLSRDTPVIVRMETLRRATLYARNDTKLAAALYQLIQQRYARFGETDRQPDALLARLDFAYLTETYREAALASRYSEKCWDFKQAMPAIDGYAMMTKLIAQGGGPEMEFA